jgi:hypothetical protein
VEADSKVKTELVGTRQVLDESSVLELEGFNGAIQLHHLTWFDGLDEYEPVRRGCIALRWPDWCALI